MLSPFRELKIKQIITTLAMKTYFIFILCLTSYTLKAQSITSDTLRWNASGFKDLVSNEVVNGVTSQFITYGNQKIEWVQGGGSFVSTFTITSTSGTWSNISNTGSMTYSISGEQLTGQMTFVRSVSGVTVELTFTTGTTSTIHHSYTITSIDTL
jgi:hypothetical protein